MKRSLFLFAIAAFLLAACGAYRAAAPTESPRFAEAPNPGAPAQESYALPAATLSPAAADQAVGGGGVEAAPVERIVIQNADLAVVVPDVEKRMKEIESMAEELGGFVVSSNLYQSYTNDNVPVPEASVVIRVPAEKLDEALDRIKKDAVEVQSENRSGQDVTAEYVDLKSRLKNLEDAEAQLQEIMSKAEKTEDVINVFNQLVTYREQIEVIKGQIQYYEEAAALSAISVRLIAEETVQPIEVAGWKPQGVARDAIQGLINFLQGFADFLITFFLRDLWEILLVLLPFYVLFLIGRAIYRRMRRNRPGKSGPPAPVEKQ